jgi:hypothetical protein
MNEKQMSEKFASLKKALEDAKEILGVEDVNEDDEMKHAKICTELTALATELEQIEHKAHLLAMKTLVMDLDTDGAARLGYALAFMIKMNASVQKDQLKFSADFIRKQRPEDKR